MIDNRFLSRYRFTIQVTFDWCCWLMAILGATWLRHEFVWGEVEILGVLQAGVVAAVAQVLVGRLRGLYVHRWRYGTFEEIANAGLTVVLVTLVVVLANVTVLSRAVPMSASIMAGPLALGVMLSGRMVFRVLLERSLSPNSDHAEKLIVFGAGEAGEQVIRSLLRDRRSPYVPVALLDDAARLRNLRIKHVPVRGGRAAIGAVAAQTGAKRLLVAIPSASGQLLRELLPLADQAGLTMMVLPSVHELFGTDVGVADIRPVTESDLLGRREVHTDLDSVSHYITDRRVLVTGAGGSIGSELCRHLNRFAPECLVMLDRDESALQAVQLSIEGRGLLDDERLVVADIRDEERLREVFDRFRPQVVFHAAALKHLPLLEMHPEEGFKTNVIGTQNVIDQAIRVGVTHFVNISTDKAADATSVLGRTKRLAEQLTAFAGLHHEGRYLSVRFGNVLGSRGSFLPLFQAQIQAGGPVTVTDPDVTRYFMTIPESCELVMQAGALGRSGEVMVLDMGEPVRIDDIARRLIAHSNRRIDVVYTGLRPGEKLHEVLFGEDEPSRPSEHPMISVVEVDPIDPVVLTGTRAEVIDLRPIADSRPRRRLLSDTP